MKGITIRVPATSANLGPGFDSIGIALSKYVTLECQPADQWHFSVAKRDQPFIPSGETNLIYKSALFTAFQYAIEHLPPYHVTMTNDVPVSRGLGSSSTAVVAGIELANQILDLQLSDYDKLKIGCSIEGHPDNVAPAIFGGIMVSNYDGNNLDYVHFTKGMDELSWVTVIPSYHVETEKARAVLPESMSYKSAVLASGTANVLVAALAEKNWEMVGKMMKRDQWHQPFRSELIPDFPTVSKILDEHGALGSYISGAGPTMIGLFQDLTTDQRAIILDKLQKHRVEFLTIDTTGLRTAVRLGQ
ncbi:homoserine kinase [Halobacillus shinanisalinarum]|uniref:Homoserine kinase n=1 Tax=Halobacillus shinanisalinarum TaxID=2932258 RepID=A0ABY4H2N4_9BACI|nr:homoserine kinase [Halobacillus shinanisalinarum]UOQ94446.1 homoserine kinase [Halobacillus shinanisalinarum]